MPPYRLAMVTIWLFIPALSSPVMSGRNMELPEVKGLRLQYMPTIWFFRSMEKIVYCGILGVLHIVHFCRETVMFPEYL